MIKLKVKERREQFLLLMGIFLVTVTVLGTCFFYGSSKDATTSKDTFTGRLSADEDFEKAVQEQRPAIDSVYQHILLFDPNVNAVFIKNDILYSLEGIRNSYRNLAPDPRHRTFQQIAALYSILFNNKRELEGNKKDIEGLNNSLEDCKRSSRQLKESLTRQNRK